MAEADVSTSLFKACKVCGVRKPLEKFPKVAKARDGRAGRCYSCSHLARSETSRAAADARVKAWKKANADRWREAKAKQDQRRRVRQGHLPRAERQAQAAHRAQLLVETKRAVRAEQIRQRPWLADGLTKAERMRLKYAICPEYNIYIRFKASQRRKEKTFKLDSLARGSMLAKRPRGSKSFQALTGYCVAELKAHLERQFTKGMDWLAFAEGRIHIDHIVPLSAFDLPAEVKEAWAITNLRPLWAADNLSKGRQRTLLL